MAASGGIARLLSQLRNVCIVSLAQAFMPRCYTSWRKTIRPIGTFDNSPAARCWEIGKTKGVASPVGTFEHLIQALFSIVLTGRTVFNLSDPTIKRQSGFIGNAGHFSYRALSCSFTSILFIGPAGGLVTYLSFYPSCLSLSSLFCICRCISCHGNKDTT
jgi:hypothetical protein